MTTTGSRNASLRVGRVRLLIGVVASCAAFIALWSTPARLRRVSPPGTAPMSWSEVDPLNAATAVAWYVAVALIAYLLLVCVANLVASFGSTRPRAPLRASPRPQLARRALASITPRFLAIASAGVILAASPAGAAERPSPATTPPLMELIEPAAAPAAPTPHTSLPWAIASTSSTTPPADSVPGARSDLEPILAPSAEPRVEPAGEGHVVQTGENLWIIAEATLTGRATNSAPSVVQVADYWRQLIEANRDRLVDPSEPDLIFPGQEFVLP